MNIKLLTEHHLEFLSLKGGSTGSSESTLVKMPHCWKSRCSSIIVSLKSDKVRVTVSTVFLHGLKLHSGHLQDGKPLLLKELGLV